MASVNKVIIIGNLGRDPEVRSFPDGGSICNITVATTRRWKARDSNEFQEETEWHRVVFRDRLAEIAGEYLRKGRPVYVEGRLKTRKWQDKEGRDTYTTEIVADQMQLLGGREGMGGGDEDGSGASSGGNGGGGGGGYRRNAGGSSGGGGGYGGGDSEARERPARAPAPAPRPAPKSNTGFDDMDDDIPF